MNITVMTKQSSELSDSQAGLGFREVLAVLAHRCSEGRNNHPQAPPSPPSPPRPLALPSARSATKHNPVIPNPLSRWDVYILDYLRV